MGTIDARPDLVERGVQAASLERRLEQLPDNHPASPRYGRDNRGDVRPLTDAEHAEHVADVRARLDEARKAGLATDVQHTIDLKHEIWSDEREALHDALLDDIYSQASSVPSEFEAIIAGGISGAGKTTVLTDHAGINLSRYLMINPDLIKEEMAKCGLIPEVDGLTPMEASELAHEESSHLAKRLAHRAHADGKNVIWDVTMCNASSADERIDWLRDAGYSRVSCVFVDISVEASKRRADGRYRQAHDDYRAGQALGGRLNTPEMIDAQADREWGTKNRATFEKLKPRFDAWTLFENDVDGRDPVLVDSSSMEHRHEETSA
jgi:predicted kinase